MIRGVLLALLLAGCTRDNPGLEIGSDDGGADLSAGGGDGGCGAMVASDPRNCGACGHDCTKLPHVQAALVHCTSGVCDLSNACRPGWDHCTANPNDGCETDLSSPSHCGGCAIQCTASDPLCIPWGPGHTCAASCPGGTPTNCSGTCTNVKSDPKNCNGCGHQCPAPANGNATCTGGVCGHTCSGGYVACGDSCIAIGTCCTNADCTSPQTCPGPGQMCNCPNGQKWCAQSASCIASGSCCSAADCSTGVANASPSCSLGVCGYTCNFGFRACNGGCIPQSQCCTGADCSTSVANATPVCASGTCGYMCNATFQPCGSACIGAGMCCLNSDCTTTVANATPLCNGGACTFQCNATFRRCNGGCIPAGNCCVNGDCNTAVANASPFCNAGTCDFVCNSGYQRSGNSCVACASHSNGMGQTYVDCSPLGKPGVQSTYSATMAMEAAQAWGMGTPQFGQCSTGNAYTVSWQTTLESGCTMWLYTGQFAGYLRYNHITNAGVPPQCLCPVDTTFPTWN